MKTSRLPTFVLALLFLSSGLAGCITDPVTGDTVIGMPWSNAEEIELGNSYYPSFRSQYEGAYPDPELQAHLEGIVLGMAAKSHRPELPWTFTILNSSEVNAFALPGGNVCITRGLLTKMDSEAEFAGVMGHEIGHVSHKHAAQGAGRSALFGIVLVAATVAAQESDSELAEVGLTLGAVGGQLLLLKYSRDQESESDQRGVEYSVGAGYDPRAMKHVFETFKELKGDEAPPEILSTHPLDDDRIAAIDAEVAEKFPQIAATNGAGLRKSTPTWNRLADRLRRAQEVYDVYDELNEEYAAAVKAGDTPKFTGILSRLRECERLLPGHALFVSGMGVVLRAMGRERQARPFFTRAISLQGDLFEPHAHLAEIAYADGDRAAAIRHAERAAELFPHHPLGHYIAGRAHDDSGRVREAVPSYRMVLELAPDQSEAYLFCNRRLTEIQGAE